MSAWLLALGISAGYLINKNLQIKSRLNEGIKVYQEAAKPADPGPASSEIRRVQRTVPDADKYESMNIQDLSREDVDKLRIAREGAFNEVVAYESGAPPIQGVYLTFDNHGV